MKKKLRIAFARINQETNALSPVLTTLPEFEQQHYLRGDELLRATGPGTMEVESFFRRAELTGFVKGVKETARRAQVELELVPLISAWATPSGPLSRECYDALTGELLTRLRAAGPVDVVYLCLHGAMGVCGLELSSTATPDSEIVRRVREQVGPEAVIGVSLDLHGNVSQDLIRHADVVQAYRTNPHRDHVAIGRRVGRLTVRTALGEIRPVMAWRSLPVLLGGGNTIDFLNPMRGIFRRMKELERDQTVLGASVLSCHPWNDHPELGWSTIVITDGLRDPAGGKAEALAEELAERCWAIREQQPPRFLSPEEAIERARRARLRRKLGVVVFSDASDVVSAGAPGDNTRLARALIEGAQGLVSYVPIRDPQLVAELWPEEVGARIKTVVGGRVDPQRGAPLEVEGVLTKKGQAHAMERYVILDVGTVRLLVVEGSALVAQPRFFKNAGLNVLEADIVVVKNFFPFLLYFLPYSRMNIFVRTEGVTDFDAAFRLPFAGEVHPRDRVASWRPADARRRMA